MATYAPSVITSSEGSVQGDNDSIYSDDSYSQQQQQGRIYDNFDDTLHHVTVRNPYPDPDPDPDPPPRPPPPAAHHAPLINLIGPPQGPAAKPPTALEDERGSKSALMGLKVVSEIFLSSLVLLCTVFSKLSLVGLTDDLTEITRLVNNGSGSDPSTVARGVALYWQLLLILLIPNFITFLRCMLFGCLGKSGRSFPFPTQMAVVVGLLVSTLEVLAISTLLFLVLSEFSPGVSILLFSGVFISQTIINVFDNDACCNSYRPKYIKTTTEEPRSQRSYAFFSASFCSISTKLIAFTLQATGILGIISYFAYKRHVLGAPIEYRIVVGMPLAIIVLSIVWSNRCQAFISKSSICGVSARYKSAFINSSARMLLYPLATYFIYRFATPFQQHIDPWCITNSTTCSVEINSPTLSLMVVHIISSFLGYVVVWVSCTMTINQFSLGLSLLLSTPVAVGIYYATKYVTFLNRFYDYFFIYDAEEEFIFGNIPIFPIIASLFWIAEVLAVGYFICTKRNLILARDCDMFMMPSYNSVFLKQHIILNRHIKIPECNSNRSMPAFIKDNSIPRTIFICSTMYRENCTEMEQMLTSIYRVAQSFGKRDPFWQNCRIESHIFMDGAINGNQIEGFGLQLLSLVEKAFDINLNGYKGLRKTLTPYGYRLSLDIGPGKLQLPFNIHFKDKNHVKPKKRWSQIMYMNYVINYRIKKKNLNPDHTFILTTDADIDFTANSAIVLLDMLATDNNVAAVCARTHPRGTGPLYWYQIFDYAIGHWFQKPAEHIMGSVLCAPGCFSVYRCSALSKILKEYSSEVEGAVDFLKKDMGEDRWMCTLLIKEGLRLEYCAISENHTYCPNDFAEFFKQRRRWIPSTVANLMDLISESKVITRKNDSISILFIIYQILIMFSTAIAPATVILIISAGLEDYDFAPSPIIIISILVILCVVYGCICLYTSPKTQLDVSKLLSIAFGILMLIVVIGILKNVVDEFVPTEEPPEEEITESPGTNSTDAPFELPVGISTIYIGILVVLFPFAALCHFSEGHNILHGVWFLLGLPAGYLLLPIYSAVNLCDRSWGTREQNNGEDEGLWGWRKYPIMLWKKISTCLLTIKCCKSKQSMESLLESEESAAPLLADGNSEVTGGRDSSVRNSVAESDSVISLSLEDQKDYYYYYTESPQMDEGAMKWLRQHKSEKYAENFEWHGYTNIHFIADMRTKDFEAIGIDQIGFRLRLEKAAKLLPPLHIDIKVPTDIATWLTKLELGQYKDKFHAAGYEIEADMEHLKKLDEKQLREMGISKRAHLRRLQKAIHNLKKPSGVEQRKKRAKSIVDSLDTYVLEEDEKKFWEILIHLKLKPVSAQLTDINDIHQSLLGLRNSTMFIFFFINISWLILLGYFSFDQLKKHNIDPRAIQIFFLAVYGLLLVIQTVAMLAHRAVTLIHYLGRL